jgi:hypothetical protein
MSRGAQMWKDILWHHGGKLNDATWMRLLSRQHLKFGPTEGKKHHEIGDMLRGSAPNRFQKRLASEAATMTMHKRMFCS